MTPALLIRTSSVAVPGLGEGAHGGEVGEVEAADLARARARAAAACSPFAAVADGEHDVRAGAAERARRDQADAAVGAGDHDGAAVEAGRSAAVHFASASWRAM